MSDKTESGLPRVVAIAWGLLAEPTRGPKRGVSHERIIETAVEIADAEGIGAVTMSRVAEKVGFSTMALYRYVTNKEELLMLMLDAATTLGESPHAEEDWRVATRHWVDRLRAIYTDHPWALDVPRGPTSVLMPSAVTVADSGLQVIAGLRLRAQEQVAFILSISSYVSAFAQLERDLAAQEELVLGPEAMAELATVITPERLPALAPLLLGGGYAGSAPQSTLPTEQTGTEPANDVEFEFRWGLDRLLDGIEQLHESRPADWAG